MTRFTTRTRAWSASLAIAATISTVSGDEWIQVKDIGGRKLTVKIEKVEGDNVKFSTKNGKSYTYPISKFSVADQVALRKWKPRASSESTVKENSVLKRVGARGATTIYRTKHFEFEVVGSARAAQLKNLAPVFEATHWAFSKLPVSVELKPANSHFKVRFYALTSDFEIASGESLAAGRPAIYNLSDDILVAPLERLQASPGLRREIGFALLGQRLHTWPPWLAAGITEYLAAASYKDLDGDMKKPLANVVRYLDKTYNLSGENLPMLSPSAVVKLDYSALWDEAADGIKNRSSALLAFYYFAHLDRKGEGLDGYVRAIRTNTAPGEALALLTNGREPARLEDELVVAFLSKKLRIAFIR